MKRIVTSIILIMHASASWSQGYLITTGPGAIIAPSYEGAKNIEVGFLPWFNARPAGDERRPLVPDDNLGIGLNSGPVEFTIVAGFRGKRDSTSERTGLSEIKSAYELGLAMNYWPRDWLRTRIELRKGFGGHTGWVGMLGADVFRTAGPFTFVAGPRLGLGDQTYMNKYFGISPAEAAGNAVVSTPFSPKAGIRYYGVATGVNHKHGNWQEVAGVTWRRLAGDAAKSPAVSQIGEANQVIITLGIMYTFSVGG